MTLGFKTQIPVSQGSYLNLYLTFYKRTKTKTKTNEPKPWYIFMWVLKPNKFASDFVVCRVALGGVFPVLWWWTWWWILFSLGLLVAVSFLLLDFILYHTLDFIYSYTFSTRLAFSIVRNKIDLRKFNADY